MLVNSRNMLNKAKKAKSVVFQFNINNLEWTKIILEKCDSMKVPVILGASEGCIKYMGGYNVVSSTVYSLICDLNITIDVCLHLDHASSVESCFKAIDAGFNSVMIDTSKLPLDDNIREVKEVVRYAKNNDVTVEGEVGHIGGVEDDINATSKNADFNECLRFVKETNVDSLAAAVGTVHGLYKGEVNINYDLIEKLSNALSVPLVLHGGSSLDNSILKKTMESGISKININSDLQYSWYNAIVKFINENKDIYDPRKVIMSGSKAIMDTIEEKYCIMDERK